MTSRCQQLRRLGLSVGHRPFAYHNTPQLLLDSFVQYTNATRYRVRRARARAGRARAGLELGLGQVGPGEGLSQHTTTVAVQYTNATRYRVRRARAR